MEALGWILDLQSLIGRIRI